MQILSRRLPSPARNAEPTIENGADFDLSLNVGISPEQLLSFAPAPTGFLWFVSRQELHQHRIAGSFGGNCSTRQPLVGLPVHSLWLEREGLVEAATATKTHPEILRLAQRPIVRALVLAFISESVAMPAREQFGRQIDFRHTPAAISSTGVDRALEPWSTAPKAACGPEYGDTLLYGLPV